MNKNRTDNKLPKIDTLWDYSNPEGTAIKFEKLLAKAIEANDICYVLELKTQMARTQSLQLKFQEAHAILNDVEKELLPDMIVPKVRCSLERGRTFNSANFKKEAIEHFNLAYDLAIKNKEDFYAIDAAHMLAISVPADKKLDWNIKALELCEKSKDSSTKKWKGSLYNNIGWDFHSQGKFDEALDMFEKCLSHNLEMKDDKRVFVSKWSIARALRSLTNVDEALDIQYNLLNEIKAGKAEEDGYVYEEIGECLLLQENFNESSKYFRKAHELLSGDKWLQTYGPARLKRLESFIK